MAAQASETILLRTYPLQEADLIVSFFTRDQGKLRGVAKRARKFNSGFGSGLQRLSHIKMYYSGRENQELLQLHSCDLIQSQFGLLGSYDAATVLDYMAEVSEGLLPPAEPNERFFRLLLTVLNYLRSNPERGVWPAIVYFSLWAVRLSGILPDLIVSADSRQIADEMIHRPIAQLTEREWTRSTAQDLRRFLIRQIQDHIEHKLHSAPMLEAL